MRAQAYERMIALGDAWPRSGWRNNRKPAFVSVTAAGAIRRALAEVAPIVRGACSLPDSKIDGRLEALRARLPRHDAVMNFVNGAEVARYGQAGVVTPDHNIRIKNWPLVVAAPADGGSSTPSRARSATRSQPIGATLPGLFRAQQRPRRRHQDHARSRCRAWCWCPASACSGSAAARRTRAIAADLAEAAIATITDAEAVGRFEPLPEADLFEIEYWSLEQAKLGQAPRSCRWPVRSPSSPAAAGAIGAATAQAFAAAGAEVALLDVDEAAAPGEGQGDRRRGARARCDVTDAASVRGAFARSPPRSAASISWCRMPARPGRAGSARWMRRCCARASS